MTKYKITVKQLVANKDLDYDDANENPSGEHTVTAMNEEKALDVFHLTIPIAVLDDFDISIKEVTDD